MTEPVGANPAIGSTISAEFAELFALRKGDIVDLEGSTATVRQLGATYVAEPDSASRWEWPDGLSTDETIYEMFVVNPSSGVTAMGACDEVDAWQPLAERAAEELLGALGAAGIALAGDLSLSASLTPLDEVSTGGHFDDGQFTADEDLGIVAIIGSHGGPQVSFGSITVHNVFPPPSDLNLAPPLGDADIDFDWGAAASQNPSLTVVPAAADRVVLFPQFGQLHSGPRLGAKAGECRQLFVLRGRVLL